MTILFVNSRNLYVYICLLQNILITMISPSLIVDAITTYLHHDETVHNLLVLKIVPEDTKALQHYNAFY